MPMTTRRTKRNLNDYGIAAIGRFADARDADAIRAGFILEMPPERLTPAALLRL